MGLSRLSFLNLHSPQRMTYDENGTRYGFPGNYSGHALGFSHNFSPVFPVRPEIGCYRSYNSTAFDNGARSDLWLYGFDMTFSRPTTKRTDFVAAATPSARSSY